MQAIPSAAATATPPFTPAALPVSGRIASVDIYRGFVMLLMMAEVLNLQKVSAALPDSGFWSFLAFNQSHVPWAGCSLHDMIQPSFSFLVGVALPFSMAARMAKGESVAAMWRHTLVRSLILILLGIFLRSMHSEQTNFTFEDTLTMIGLGYPFLFALGFCQTRTRIIACAAILFGYWLAFALYPVQDPGEALTGVPPGWVHNFDGFAAHWNKNTNLAWAFDTWFLNLFPRESPFLYNGGGYATLSFIPTLGTMILGTFAGQALKADDTPQRRIRLFLYCGIGLLVAGLLLHVSGICPIVKRIWTPSWTLASGGGCFLFTALFYWLADVAGYKRAFFVLTVIGVNSIAAYVLADGFGGFLKESLYIHLGRTYDQVLGAPYTTLVQGFLALGLMWFILYRMYRKKIFIKI